MNKTPCRHKHRPQAALKVEAVAVAAWAELTAPVGVTCLMSQGPPSGSIVQLISHQLIRPFILSFIRSHLSMFFGPADPADHKSFNV